MSRMVRKQVYIESAQEELLKSLARELEVTEAELIRRAIERQLRASALGWLRPQAWEDERLARTEWLQRAREQHPKQRHWTRDELYEERIGRYDRARSR